MCLYLYLYLFRLAFDEPALGFDASASAVK